MGTFTCENCRHSSCNPKEFKLCSGCKETYYCSQECQKQHWKAHKNACKLLQINSRDHLLDMSKPRKEEYVKKMMEEYSKNLEENNKIMYPNNTIKSNENDIVDKRNTRVDSSTQLDTDNTKNSSGSSTSTSTQENLMHRKQLENVMNRASRIPQTPGKKVDKSFHFWMLNHAEQLRKIHDAVCRGYKNLSKYFLVYTLSVKNNDNQTKPTIPSNDNNNNNNDNKPKKRGGGNYTYSITDYSLKQMKSVEIKYPAIREMYQFLLDRQNVETG